ncbi:MAG: hypothetical protein N2663_03665 [Chlorobi bacterium]|nr:hypothetical protein [Chlorobiota bacterium]
MSNRNRIQQMLAAYYCELSPEEQRDVERRLKNDPEFAAQYADLCRLLDAFTPETAYPLDRHAESEEFWTALEYNILRRIRTEARTVRPHNRLTQWWSVVAAAFQRIAARPVAVAAGIAVAFVCGITVGTQRAPISAVATSSESMTPPGATAASAAAHMLVAADPVSNFLKRSQVYIATAADKQLQCSRCIPIERQIDHRQMAHELLTEAQRLRPLARHNPKVKKVLDQVELVLANLAEQPEQLSRGQMEVLHHIASTTVCEVNSALETQTVPSQP